MSYCTVIIIHVTQISAYYIAADLVPRTKYKVQSTYTIHVFITASTLYLGLPYFAHKPLALSGTRTCSCPIRTCTCRYVRVLEGKLFSSYSVYIGQLQVHVPEKDTCI